MPGMVLGWWDREYSETGEPIRRDVRDAAHQIWERARRKAAIVLGDDAEAAEIMELTVRRVSCNVERKSGLPAAHNIAALLMVAFTREVNRMAAKRRRIQCAGSALDLDRETPQVAELDLDRRIDQKRIV